MTEEQEKQEESLEALPEPTLKFKLPEMEDLDLFVVELEDGRKVVRTAEELEEDGQS